MKQQSILLALVIGCCYLNSSVICSHFSNSKLVVTECPLDYEPLQGLQSHEDRIVGYIPYLSSSETDTTKGKTPQINTNIQVCHRGYSLLDITWHVNDSSIIADFTQCNQPLDKQDVSEVFIASPDSYMNKYLQVQVNPQGALYAANVENHSDNCSKVKTHLLPCDSTGIFYSAVSTDYGYSANVKIPLSDITKKAKTFHLKGNFFGLKLQQDGTQTSSFWRPNNLTPVCFHNPSSFGDIMLV